MNTGLSSRSRLPLDCSRWELFHVKIWSAKPCGGFKANQNGTVSPIEMMQASVPTKSVKMQQIQRLWHNKATVCSIMTCWAVLFVQLQDSKTLTVHCSVP